MDTIKIFDLEQMNGGKGAGNRLKASMRATVSPNKKIVFQAVVGCLQSTVKMRFLA